MIGSTFSLFLYGFIRSDIEFRLKNINRFNIFIKSIFYFGMIRINSMSIVFLLTWQYLHCYNFRDEVNKNTIILIISENF